MSRYRVTVGSDAIVVELGQPEHPILVDGDEIGYQCADGSCRVEDCLRLAVGRAFACPVYDDVDEARAAGYTPGVDNVVVWDDPAVSYEEIEDEGES